MDIPNSIRRIVPPSLRPALRRLGYFTADNLDVMLGRRDPLTPPRRMWAMVGTLDHDFKEMGKGCVDFLIKHCDLKPEESVLDVGCGIGRYAAPLTGYLKPTSRYEGFDIVAEGVEWCRKNISRRFPNFRFQVPDIYNKTYNPAGRYKASEFRFPYDDESFDVVVLGSVFTHMLTADVAHYVAEIARVMKPGGRFLISFYLLNDTTRENIEAGSSEFDFKFELGGCYAQHEERPEAAIAYDEEWVRRLFEKHGFEIAEPIIYGVWSYNKEQSQDIVIGMKTRNAPGGADDDDAPATPA